MSEPRPTAAEKMQGMEDYLRAWGQLLDMHPGMKRQRLKDGVLFGTTDEAVYHHGDPFPTDPLTDDERAVLLKLFKHLPFVSIIKQCFRNSTLLAQHARMLEVPLHYAEGKCASLIPIDHAWCSLNGKPIDITLRELNEGNIRKPEKLLARVERNLAENAYWGYEVPYRERNRHLIRNRRYCPVMDDPAGGYPLMKSKTLPWKESA